ncbi:major outer membrane protein [Campylobacter coli]|nr:major outer membrane protein [Campylobacter coli]EAL8233366.1 major outer membrane protein [Campylobacter coli]EDO8984905.1 major outer membrane protein [Campylobacter coli]EIS5086463.1 major outer membrane protein [Campylobacter coli]
MKLVKLSLVAALAAGAFSVANATPLEEAIKDIDVSGVLRYRYETSNEWSDINGVAQNEGSGISGKQEHKYRAQINFSGAIADNFKAFVQLDYNAKDGGYGANSVSDTKTSLNVRQLYLTYTNEDVATSVILGKQQLNTIWTDNAIDGLVGTGIKVVNNSIDGLTLAAFAIDSVNTDEQGEGIEKPSNSRKSDENSPYLDWSQNIYGAAAIGSYEVFNGQLNPQLWLAYMTDNAFLYALDVAYNTTIFDGVNWTLEGAYLGNSLDNKLEDHYKVGNESNAGNGNFFALRGSVEVNGWDATLGGLYYGKKDKVTVTVLEDQGNIGSLLAGEEIFYTNGSQLHGSLGRNIFGYVKAGYTFNETVRVGADFVYGGTKTENHSGGDKLEAVARVDYKYSPKLNFSAFYSYVNVDKDTDSTHHDAVRLQALYKF